MVPRPVLASDVDYYGKLSHIVDSGNIVHPKESIRGFPIVARSVSKVRKPTSALFQRLKDIVGGHCVGSLLEPVDLGEGGSSMPNLLGLRTLRRWD